jgi:hypothetical protein
MRQLKRWGRRRGVEGRVQKETLKLFGRLQQ